MYLSTRDLKKVYHFEIVMIKIQNFKKGITMQDKKCITVGGQALIEGIMMKSPEKTSVVVRAANGEIKIKTEENKKMKFKNIPIVRGIEAFLESIIQGYRHLMYSADISLDEGEEELSKFEKWLIEKLGDKSSEIIGTFAAVLGGMLAIVLFMALPTGITGLIDAHIIQLGIFKAAVEGILKIVIFLIYLYLVGLNKEASRLFEYHGAEHKAITCYENKDELTIENVRKHSRFHPRCGTSFMLIILVVSIIMFSFIPWGSTASRVVMKLIALPVVMGVSYEILRFNGRKSNSLTKALSAPGMWFQRLTTKEPTDDMIEVAIKSIIAVLPNESEELENEEVI